MSLEFKKKYEEKLKKDPSFRKGDFKTYNNEPSLTRSDMRDDADINKIVQKYTRLHGQMPVASPGTQLYQDVSNVGDYRSALDKVIVAKDAFRHLGPEVSKRFKNDPDSFVEFIGNPENLEEGRKLGIFVPEKDKENPEPAPKPAPETPKEA